jgi:hypothetical protein
LWFVIPQKITKITDVYVIMLFTLYKSMMTNWYRDTWLKPMNENLICVLTDISSFSPLLQLWLYWEWKKGWTALNYGDEWLISHVDNFTARKGNQSTHWIGGWMGLRASADILETSWIFCPFRDFNPKSFVL